MLTLDQVNVRKMVLFVLERVREMFVMKKQCFAASLLSLSVHIMCFFSEDFYGFQ